MGFTRQRIGRNGKISYQALYDDASGSGRPPGLRDTEGIGEGVAGGRGEDRRRANMGSATR